MLDLQHHRANVHGMKGTEGADELELYEWSLRERLPLDANL